MNNIRILTLVFLFLVVFLPGCETDGTQPLETNTGLPPAITPYRTATSVIDDSDAPSAPTPMPPPLPSPTPFMYTIVENDTLIAIAVRFGISLDELQVANPEVNPNILSLGTQLVIPVSFEEQEESASSEVVLKEGEVECFQIRSGGLRCYWLVTNTLDEAVENIAGVIRLYDQSGQQVASKNAVPLLNLLEPEMQAPLSAFFEPPLGDWQIAQGQILTAVKVNQYEERYLKGVFEGLQVEVREGGLHAEVSGKLAFGSEGIPDYVWIMAIAHDAAGELVGVKRWEAPSDLLSDSLDFSFVVFSLGRPIDQVRLQYEARSSGSTDLLP